MTENEHVSAIFCLPEVAGDVISGGDVKAAVGYVSINFEAASVSSFRENPISHSRNAYPTAGPLEPHFRDQGAKMYNRLQKRT